MAIQNKDYRDIKTSFCFLDETGLLNSEKDKYFALGIIKCKNPEKLYNIFRSIRDRNNYHEELKWAQINSPIRFKVATDFFKCFLRDTDTEFNCIILNKNELDFQKEYNNDLSRVYRSFTISLLKLIVGKIPEEVLIVLADNYFTPENFDLENTIKKFTNSHYQKFVVAGVCQIDSKCSDLLQLTDLVLGAIVYDLKKIDGIIQGASNTYKRKFLNFIYQKLQIKKSFFINSSGFRTRNYVLSGTKIRATIFDCKRSRVKEFFNKKQAMTHNG
jgi:hypothetical protein